MKIRSVDKVVLSVILTLSGVAATAQEHRGSRPGGGSFRPEPPPPPLPPPGFGGGRDDRGGRDPRPPMPPPGGGSRSSIIGEVRTVTDQGEVMGWACDTQSRAALQLAVYINGNRERYLNPEASLNVRMDRQMGNPDRACGDQSGFKFQIPRERFDGSVLKVEVRGLERMGREQVYLGERTFRTPADRIRETLFTVDSRTYYSNGRDAFCYITSPDQLKLFNSGRRLSTERLQRLPGAMRNDGDCAQIPFPKAIFFTRASGGTGWFSNGQNAYCGLPFPGMLVHIAAATGISTNADQYDALPLPQSMANHGICKVEGVFQVGPHIYYANGQDAFCRMTHPDQVAGRRVFAYESLPPGVRNDGDCR